MSGFICARYTIAHLIWQMNNQSKQKKKESLMENKTGHGYLPVRITIETK